MTEVSSQVTIHFVKFAYTKFQSTYTFIFYFIIIIIIIFLSKSVHHTFRLAQLVY